jgi:Helix-turn-helix of DDE superfamily endonuclease
LRFKRMSGLDEEQLGELEYRVAELLEQPWDKGAGRPRELTLREALVVTCGYLRQNIIEDVWADIFDVDQSTISRYITFLTPFVEKATAEDRPTAEDATEATRGAIALVDGTLWPCWSWDGESKLCASRTGRRHLEDMADSLHRLSSAPEDRQVVIPCRNRALLFQGEFCITLRGLVRAVQLPDGDRPVDLWMDTAGCLVTAPRRVSIGPMACAFRGGFGLSNVAQDGRKCVSMRSPHRRHMVSIPSQSI